LLEELDVEFEEEVKWEEFLDPCDFPNWFPICCFECSLFLGPAYHGIFFCFLFQTMDFKSFLSFTLDYGCHSCKVYVGLAKEKSLNYMCYFLVLLLKLQTSNLQAWNIIWFLKLETWKNFGFFSLAFWRIYHLKNWL
jgi:hypothetical protein